MTEDTSVESKVKSPEPTPFLKVTAWRASIMKPEHVAEFMPLILETVLASLPPSERVDPVMKANITGAIVDGRLQVWGILGKMADTGQWRPVGYGTTGLIPDELTQKKTCLIYTLFSYAEMDDSVYVDFWKVITDYARDQGCAKVALYSNNARILSMAESVGMSTEFRFVFKNLE